MREPPGSDSRGGPSSDLVAHQRALVDETHDLPRLRGGACEACGYRFFPFQTYGCECCGAHGDQLKPLALACTGKLQNLAAIRRGEGDRHSFVVARVMLEGGIVVRAVLTGNVETAGPGTPLVGRWIDAEENGLRELRFEVRT